MVQVQLFGHFALRYGKEPIQIRSQPIKELLSYLLINRGREYSREKLANELWGERSTTQSLKTLRQVLWQFKKFFEDKGIKELTLCDREFPQLELCSTVKLDISFLDEVGNLLDHHKNLTTEDITNLRKAAAAYKGDLLEDWQYEWCLIERERYRSLHLAILDTLVETSILNREVQAGLLYTHQALALEPDRECTHRQLMEVYLLQGNRTAAIRQFDQCSKLLKEEYGIEPSASTIAVYQRARGGTRSTPKSSSQNDLSAMVDKALGLLKDIKHMLEP